MPLEPEDIQRLGDVLQPLSGKDLVQLWQDEEAIDTLRYAAKRIADDELVVEFPGSTKEHKGVDGFIDGWREFLANYTRFIMAIEDVLPRGDVVFVTTKQQGETSAGEVEKPADAGATFTFNDEGRLTRAVFRSDRKAARKDAGLG